MRIFIMLAALSLNTPAADWPQWRGPSRQGFTTETGVPGAYPAEGLKLLWKADFKDAITPSTCKDNGSPVAAAGLVYLMVRTGAAEGVETLFCINLADGKEVWQQAIQPKGQANSTPAVDPATSRVYVNASASGNKIDGPFAVECLDAKTGAKIWHQDQGKLGLTGQPGDAGSPLIWDKLLITACMKKVFALNKETGAIVWSWPEKLAEGEEAPAYRSSKNPEDVKKYVEWHQQLDKQAIVGIKASSSPILAEIDQRPVIFQEVLRLADTGYCSSTVALDAKTGKQLWLGPWLGSHHTPIFSDGLLVTTVFTGDAGIQEYAQQYFLAAYKPQWNKDVLEFKEAWRTAKSVGKRYRLPSPIAVNKKLYLRERGFIQAFDLMTGKSQWFGESLSQGTQWPITSPVWAGGKLFHVIEDGTLKIISDQNGMPEVLLTQKVCGSTDASPIIVDGKFLMRDRKTLYCYALAAVTAGK